MVITGDKCLLEMNKVKFVNVPRYDELGVKNVMPLMKDDKDFLKYFPDQLPKGRTMDRIYFWNILNTLRHDYAQNLIKHANT